MYPVIEFDDPKSFKQSRTKDFLFLNVYLRFQLICTKETIDIHKAYSQAYELGWVTFWQFYCSDKTTIFVGDIPSYQEHSFSVQGYKVGYKTCREIVSKWDTSH